MARQLVCLLFLSGSFAGGCSTPGSQVSQCQADKDQLLATIRQQRDTIRAQREQLASQEERLDESEKALAGGGKPGIRVSSRPVEETKLPWRSPDQRGSSASASPKDAIQSRSPDTTSRPVSSLAALAARDKRLQFDRQSGVASVNVPLGFAENSAQLTAEARRQLDDVAQWLKSKDAAELKVLVSGIGTGRPPKTGDGAFASARQLGAARAQAVADYLDSHGIAEERLGVIGVGSRVAATPAASQSAASGVQIFVAEPQTELAGWRGSAPELRR